MMPVDLSNYDAVIETPVASMNLGIITTMDTLTTIDLLPSCNQECPPRSDASREVANQLQAYFDDSHRQFSLSLTSQGTDFQRRVWRLMRSIPVGERRCYGEVASTLNSVARAVGGACRRNPVPVVVPCHRIVAASGIGGFNGRSDGAALDFKWWLLLHEQA